MQELVSKLSKEKESLEAGGNETKSFDEAKKKWSFFGKGTANSDAKAAPPPDEPDEDAELDVAYRKIDELEAKLLPLRQKRGSPETVAA